MPTSEQRFKAGVTRALAKRDVTLSIQWLLPHSDTHRSVTCRVNTKCGKYAQNTELPKKTGTFEIRSDSNVQLAALRNRDLELQTTRHLVIMDQWNGQQRAVKCFTCLDFSKVSVFLGHPVQYCIRPIGIQQIQIVPIFVGFDGNLLDFSFKNEKLKKVFRTFLL
jgi:hypothetical protein